MGMMDPKGSGLTTVSEKNLEELTEKWSDHYETVWVICGPLIFKGKVKLWLGEEGLIRGNGIIYL